MSKINLWMKSCKQLESEKQALQEELQQQGQQIAALQALQKQGMDKTQENIKTHLVYIVRQGKLLFSFFVK